MPTGGQDDFIFGYGVYFPELPASTGRRIEFRDSTNTTLFSIHYLTDGSIDIIAGADSGNVIVSSQGPVLTAGTWHHLEVHFTVAGAGLSACRMVKDGAIEVINAVGIDLGETVVAQYAYRHPGGGTAAQAQPFYDDIFIKNTDGDTTNDFTGDQLRDTRDMARREFRDTRDFARDQLQDRRPSSLAFPPGEPLSTGSR
jgi:hypothetical protein